MHCRRFRKLMLLLITLGAILLPALLWVAIVLIAPTSWARNYVIAACWKRRERADRAAR